MKPYIKHILICIAVLTSILFCSCANENDSQIVIAARVNGSMFQLVYNTDVPEDERADILSIRSAIMDSCGVSLKLMDDFLTEEESNYEIIVNSKRRVESAELLASLSDNEYAIRTVVTDSKTSIVIVYNGEYARRSAINLFRETCITTDGKVIIPRNLDIRQVYEISDIILCRKRT